MNFLTQIFLPLALIIIMFSMGLGLTTHDFKQVILKPKAFAIGLLCQFVTLPLIALGIANLFCLSGELAVGLMIIAACPGGVTSNVFTKLSDGDVALSIALTAVTSLVSVVTIPFIVNWSLGTYMSSSGVELPIFKSVIAMFVVTTLPVLLGMLLKAKKVNLAERLEKKLSKISVLLFIIVVAAALAKESANILTYMKISGGPTLLLNVVTMVLSMIIALSIKIPGPQVRTILLECGIQNGTLAIMIAATFLQNQMMAIPGAIYSLQMFVTGAVVISAAKYLQRKRALSPL